MFASWRFKLREAEEALSQGRLSDAAAKVRGELQEFLPGQRLAGRVAERLAQRAEQRATAGEVSAGWRDLESARELGGETEALLAAQRKMTEWAGREAEKYLESGEFSQVLALIELLAKHHVQGDQLQQLQQIARHCESARNLARRGRFRDAQQVLNEVVGQRPDLEMVRQQRDRYQEGMRETQQLQQQLHKAMADNQWTEVVSVADQLLELAPEHRLAREARSRAWQQVGATVDDSRTNVEETNYLPAGRGLQPALSATAVCDMPPQDSQRFLLWVDAVGGFLVCMQDELVIGQAAPDNQVDVPILGDLSRQHAILRRLGDGYVIEPLQETRVSGRRVNERTLLSNDDEIELGQGVRFRFRQPHALSASVRLDLISRHRTQPSADGILLMAESCVLGPQTQNHVVCRDWASDVVLYRQADDLYCRSLAALEIDGQVCEGRGKLGPQSRVVGEDFAITLEPI